MKIVNHINTYIKDNWYLIFFVFGIALNEIFVRVFCELGETSYILSKSGLFLNALYLFIIVTALSLFKSKPKKIISSLFLFVYSFYSFAQAIHFLFFRTLFSFRKLSAANELAGVMGEVVMKFKPNHLIFLVPFIVYLIILLLDTKLKKNNVNYNFKVSLSFLMVSIIVFLIGTLFFNNHMAKEDIESNPDAYLYQEFTSNKNYYDRFGSFSYISRDLSNIIISTKNTSSDEEIDEITSFINELDNTDITLNSSKYEGKNLIFILCESLSDVAIREDLTPTLYRLTKEGTYYSNFYAPLYASNTCDSEFIALTGMVPSIDYETTSKAFANNYYPYALPNLFKEKGYEVNSYHSHEKSFYNREQLHYSLGFTYFYDKNDLGLYRDGFVEYYNWYDDKDLFEKTLDNTDTSKPFFDFIITASGHLPYFVERDELWASFYRLQAEYPEMLEQEAFYYAAQMKLDEGLEYLLARLENEGILDDTIIILFGDHYPYGLDEETIDKVYSDLDEDYEIYKTPMIIYDGSTGSGENTKLTSTFDLYPTIVSLFNLDDSGAYVVGEDVTSDSNNEIVLFVDHSVLGNGFYYNGETSKLTGSDSDGLVELAKKHYKYSQLILNDDYFSKVK